MHEVGDVQAPKEGGSRPPSGKPLRMGTSRRGRGSRGEYGIGECGGGLGCAARVPSHGDMIVVEAIPGNGGEGQFDVTEENDGRVAIGGAFVLVGDAGA